MSRSPGTKLAHYEILEPIGKGGMGEVYRARDAQLGRDVAIKVLPEEFVKDEERLARFEREAKLLAQVNHANIATLHGLEEHDGQKFIVMELVEGETLAQRIAKGTIPFDEAIPLFIQIAEGLEAAHEKGIIHRDLKPANVKITPDEKPKILDFGLAKTVVGDVKADSDSSQSPTLTKETALGAIMGTAAYMSPEQARAKTLDKRTDIWAFGCVLFEALSGKKPFGGDTAADVIGSVVHKEPDWDALPESVPRRVRRLIERCLRKNPQDRLRDIGDARIELNEEEGEKPPEGSAERAPRYQVALPWAVAVVTLTIFALYLSQNAGPSAPAPIVRFALSDPVELAVSGGMMTTFALSPDGSRLVYRASTAGLSQLYLRRLEDVEPTALPGTEMSRGHVFSPDGQAVAFLTAQGELNTYSITGRLAVRRTRTRFPNSLTAGLSWNEDDEIVLGGRGRGLQIVSADGATVDEVTTLDPDLQETGHLLPAFLPGGRVVIFTRLSSDGSTAIEAFERDTGERRILMEGASGAVYASTGHLLFARDGALLVRAVRCRSSAHNWPVDSGRRTFSGGKRDRQLRAIRYGSPRLRHGQFAATGLGRPPGSGGAAVRRSLSCLRATDFTGRKRHCFSRRRPDRAPESTARDVHRAPW